MTKAFDRIKKGLEEALQFVRGETKAKVHLTPLRPDRPTKEMNIEELRRILQRKEK